MKCTYTYFAFFLQTLLILIVAFLFSVFSDSRDVVYADTVGVSVSVVFFECSDGIDNDFDGLTDFPSDPGCINSIDDDETDPQCLDGIDNDGDGFTDFPADPGCDDANDDDETNPVLPPPPGGGSGGSQRLMLPFSFARVIFSGLAHPDSRVVLLKDAVAVAETRASSDARFSIDISRITPGSYIFTMYGIDTSGVRSGLLSFTMVIPHSFLVEISDIFIPPTIYIRKVGTGQNVSVSGMTVPGAPVTISLFSRGQEHGRFDSVADSDGVYTESFVDPVFSAGNTPIKSFAVFDGLRSPYGAAAALLSLSEKMRLIGDFNLDRRVNLVDFSMLAYWYKRAGAPVKFDLNQDGSVDLVDVSMMISHWTG